MSWQPTLAHYLILAAGTFSIGLIGVMVRRNALILFMCIELMLNSVNLTFITFSQYRVDLDGQIFGFIVMAVAAGGAGGGGAIVAHIFRQKRSGNVDEETGLQQ